MCGSRFDCGVFCGGWLLVVWVCFGSIICWVLFISGCGDFRGWLCLVLWVGWSDVCGFVAVALGLC